MCSSLSNQTPVGFSLGSTRTYILDSALQPVGVGCIGEICVSGPTVGLGYFGEPEKTAAAFVKDPFRPGFRMYRTGMHSYLTATTLIDMCLDY